MKQKHLYYCLMINTNNMNTQNTNTGYTLTKTVLKSGKFQYTVTDENGNVLDTRMSGREYVACQVNGWFYFGRLDLIGKGDHGRYIKSNRECMAWSEAMFNEKKWGVYNKSADGQMHVTFEEHKAICKAKDEQYNAIAYLK